jgi:primosomal protein N' (replication factor Y)
MPNILLKIALDCPLEPLDYLAPFSENSRIGARVKVPFGTKEKIGIVVEEGGRTNCPPEKLKNIIELIDLSPILKSQYLNFIRKIAIYYQYPLGQVFAASLPANFRQGKALPSPGPLPDVAVDPSKNFSAHLSEAQKSAVKQLLECEHTYTPFLLEGVTGSGKTEVYLERIQKSLDQGKQALVLVPEISLTPQTLRRFQERFGPKVCAYHSGLSPKQRYESFTRLIQGQSLVMIGTRSAILLPFSTLDLIIVDEEHDPSYKQQDGFRYSARDLALWRALEHKCPVILGSATPSLESLANLKRPNWQHLSLPERANGSSLPNIQLIDIRHRKLTEGLSPQTLAIVRKSLAAQDHVLFFLNRRGFAPVWMCFECGTSIDCPFCDARLTVHQRPKGLQCHHCGYKSPLISKCLDCQSPLASVGLGTQRLEESLSSLFPDIPVLRLDSDSLQGKGALEKMLAQAQEPGAKILLGTQLLSKGHNLAHLNLVVILEVDAALFSVDFRATERLGQLVTQVSGRAGRFSKAGTVLLQTNFPEHPLLSCLSKKEYRVFAEGLLEERFIAQLPPYQYLALLRAESRKPSSAQDFLSFVSKEAKIPAGLRLLGPAKAPMLKRNQYYRSQLLLQARSRVELAQGLSCLRELLKKAPSNLRLSLDIDPIDLY